MLTQGGICPFALIHNRQTDTSNGYYQCIVQVFNTSSKQTVMHTLLLSPEGTATGNGKEEKLFLCSHSILQEMQHKLRERQHKVNDMQQWHINAKIKRENRGGVWCMVGSLSAVLAYSNIGRVNANWDSNIEF